MTEEEKSYTPVHTDELRVVYVHYVGKDLNGNHVYHFLVGEDIKEVWGEGWSELPAGNIRKSYMMIDNDMYSYIKELKSPCRLGLATDSGCFSMQDCRDHCIALAWEDLSEAEEYPDKGRIVLQYGELLDDFEVMLAKRDLFMTWIPKEEPEE